MEEKFLQKLTGAQAWLEKKLADPTEDAAMRLHWASQLRQVEYALHKSKDGTYGLCENCGKVINPARLDAYPSATKCIDCARSPIPGQAKVPAGQIQSPTSRSEVPVHELIASGSL